MGSPFDPYSEVVSVTIINFLREIDDELSFYETLQVIFDLDFKSPIYKVDLIIGMEKTLNYSNVNLSYEVSGSNNVHLYPKGEKLLDDELVKCALSFLKESADKHYRDSLKFYEVKDSVKSSESLRRCVEEYLRFFFKNNKGLNANITELLKFLKSKDEKSLITQTVNFIFPRLDQYFNNESKHCDGDIDENENEYLIYQVGVLLRYLSKLKK